jgi:phenolic acid decarboxylase
MSDATPAIAGVRFIYTYANSWQYELFLENERNN